MGLDELYHEYAEMIYRFIYLKCGDKELAEDIVQTTFLKAIQKIGSFKNECKISTWLCQIAKNEYRNYCRKKDRPEFHAPWEEDNGELYVRDTMLEKIISGEQAAVILKILHTLKEPYKEVFMLRVYGECSFGEIGEVFQKNDTWARVVYYRAKQKIMEGLKKTEGSYDEL
ncbi:MAG: sigma-70 family RNA polymerase sigma factor [Alistipes sp.]|nr:sigma-70 family RNA polymerase sigma factor [Alistipes sp.]